MNSNEAIINKIINDAEDTAAKNIGEAQAKADKIIADAEAKASEKKDKELSVKDALRKEIIARRITVANLDARKIILTKKSEIVEEVFAKTIDSIVKGKEYPKMIENMLMQYAEDGDEVMTAKSDAEIVTDKLIQKVAKAKKIKLNLAKEHGDFRGGIMLIGKNCDKNITLDYELREIKEEIEAEVAKILFGE